MTITVYGASDDLVEVAGCTNADEFNSDDWHGDLCAPDGTTMRIHARYEIHGCWSVGVSQVDEEYQLPGWPVTITQAAAMSPDKPGYSALLTIEAPEGTYLTGLDEGDDE